jgi:hypothetical protein
MDHSVGGQFQGPVAPPAARVTDRHGLPAEKPQARQIGTGKPASSGPSCPTSAIPDLARQLQRSSGMRRSTWTIGGLSFLAALALAAAATYLSGRQAVLPTEVPHRALSRPSRTAPPASPRRAHRPPLRYYSRPIVSRNLFRSRESCRREEGPDPSVSKPRHEIEGSVPRGLLAGDPRWPDRLSREARFVPVLHCGRATGLRVFSIPRQSPLHDLGLQDDDVILLPPSLALEELIPAGPPEGSVELIVQRDSRAFLLRVHQDERTTYQFPHADSAAPFYVDAR